MSISKDLIEIGPLSVGRYLLEKAKSFGGEDLTLSDAAIAYGSLSIPSQCISMENKLAEQVLTQAYTRIFKLYQKMAGFHLDLPLLLVGGGSGMFSPSLLTDNAIIPVHAASANAFGAALSEIGATINTVIRLSERNDVLKQLEEEVIEKAICEGAVSPRIIDRQIIPYHYAPENLARVIITAAGTIRHAQGSI